MPESIFPIDRELHSDKYIVSINELGLCNRIKSIISTMRLAKRLSITPAFYWPRTKGCFCNFSDLFESSIMEIASEIELNRLKQYPDRYYFLDTWRLLTLPGELSPDFSKRFPSMQGNEIDHEFSRIPWHFRNEFLPYFSYFVPNSQIRDEVDNFSKQFNEETISVSVRSWAEESKKRKAQFDIEDLYNKLDQHTNSNFFVCSDSQDVLVKLVRRYPDRVLIYNADQVTGDRGSIAGIQHALIELLLLSKNDFLIGSTYSTFSEMAWWFGGCRATVELFEDSTRIETFRRTLAKHDAYTRLTPENLLDIAADPS